MEKSGKQTKNWFKRMLNSLCCCTKQNKPKNIQIAKEKKDKYEKYEKIISKNSRKTKKIEKMAENTIIQEETEATQKTKQKEEDLKPKSYLKTQENFSNTHRMDLIDFMMAFKDAAEMRDETMFLAVKILDTYLENCTSQLDVMEISYAGVASLILAEKYNRRRNYKPIYEYLRELGCSYEHKLQLEMKIFKEIGFNLDFQLSYEFLHVYLLESTSIQSNLIGNYAEYILELALLNYDTRFYAESKLASAALYIAMHMNGQTWTKSMESITGYSLNDMGKIISILNRMLLNQWMDMDAEHLYKKYSTNERFRISEIMPRLTFDLFEPPTIQQ